MLQWWSDKDKEILKNLYPDAPKEEILKALNGEYRKKTWFAIQKEASRLKIKRDEKYKKVGRKKKKPRIHLGHKELADMLKTKYSIDEIAKKLRTTADTVRLYIKKYGL